MSEHNEAERSEHNAEEERQTALPVADHEAEATKRESVDPADAEVEREASRKSRRGFIVAGVSALAAIGGWEWLKTRRDDDGIPYPLRRVLEMNEGLARDYFRGSRLAPVFPREINKTPRVNGDIGLSDDFDAAKWSLNVVGLADPDALLTKRGAKKSGEDKEDNQGDENNAEETADASDAADTFRDEIADEPVVHLTLADIQQLPRVELMTQLKCIEGWADKGFWAGARLADFIAKYQPMTRSGNAPDVHNKPDDLVGYVSLATPDGEYYVGLDMASALHSQTLLVYEMGGQPLTPEHGAPLRLYVPVKYGIKSLKRIGTIRFTNKRPSDYWAERGYDWYAGH
jgi:hypothetical protein